MKKVLIITYYWPPAGGPGSQRVVKFVKYLPKFGWEPVILTVKKGEFPYQDRSLERDIPPNIKVYRTRSLEPFLLYKRLIGKKVEESLPVGLLTLQHKSVLEKIASWIRLNLFIPDARIGWVPFAILEALKIIKREKIDIIFTSSPPHSIQLIAWFLKKLIAVPWVADLRDRWTEIRYYQVIKRNFFATKLDAFWEKQILNKADYITTVTPGFCQSFKKKIKIHGTRKIHIINNGFDEDEFPKNVKIQKEFFEIVHTGNLLDYQNPENLWRSIRNLLDKNSEIAIDLKIRLIGNTHPSIIKSINDYKLNEYLIIEDFVPHQKVLYKMLKASILFAVIPKIENNKSIVLAKIYEYIGTGKPIMIIGPVDGDASEIIKDFPNSIVCDYNDVQNCQKFIEKIYYLWRKNEIFKISSNLKEKYSRKYLTLTLSKIFDSLLK